MPALHFHVYSHSGKCHWGHRGHTDICTVKIVERTEGRLQRDEEGDGNNMTDCGIVFFFWHFKTWLILNPLEIKSHFTINLINQWESVLILDLWWCDYEGYYLSKKSKNQKHSPLWPLVCWNISLTEQTKWNINNLKKSLLLDTSKIYPKRETLKQQMNFQPARRAAYLTINCCL